jgi:hypothetical protein
MSLPIGNIMPRDQLIRWWTTKETTKVRGVKHFKQFVKGVKFGCSIFMGKFDILYIQVVNSIRKYENRGKEPSYISASNYILLIVANLQQWEIMSWHDMRCQKGSRSNWPQTKSAPSQIGPKSNRPQSNRPQVKSAPDQIILLLCFLFNLIICIVNCVVYIIPNQIIVLLCCLSNLIICP